MKAHLNSVSVRYVEATLARLHVSVVETELAEQLGFLCHSPVSRYKSKINEGKKDSFLSCYSAREFLSLVLHQPALADALREALKPAAVKGTSDAGSDLRGLGQRFTSEVNEILGDLGDGIDAREADKHLDALDLISAELWRVRSALIDHKANLKEQRA